MESTKVVGDGDGLGDLGLLPLRGDNKVVTVSVGENVGVVDSNSDGLEGEVNEDTVNVGEANAIFNSSVIGDAVSDGSNAKSAFWFASDETVPFTT